MKTSLSPMQQRGIRRQPTLLVRRSEMRSGVQEGILEQAREFGWRLMDLDCTNGRVPHGYNVVGAVVGYPIDHPEGSWVKELNCPVVRIGRLPHPLDHQLPAVILDTQAVGELAAEHLGERNFRHLGFVMHDEPTGGEDIWEGFWRRAKAMHCTCHLLRLRHSTKPQTPPVRYDKRSAEVADWLARHPKPIALFVAPPNLGVPILTMVQAAGYTIPEEVAVLGCLNNVLVCESAPVPLSAVDLNKEVQGHEAVRLLRKLIGGDAPPKVPLVVRPAGVVERHSTHVLAVADPVVAEALRYLWDHFDLPLSVERIAAEVGVCRRTLERGFRNHLQRGVAAELQRKRLERCRELLAGTDLTVAEIAARVGYSSGNYLQRTFTRTFGIPPRQYRLQR